MVQATDEDRTPPQIVVVFDWLSELATKLR